MSTTKIFLKAEVDRDEVSNMCLAIAKKDKTFSWRIEGDYLTIYSPNKDVAFKRGLLFVKKYLVKYDLGFNVF
jgi:hypothetical protein